MSATACRESFENPTNADAEDRRRNDFWKEAVNLREWSETEFGFRWSELQ